MPLMITWWCFFLRSEDKTPVVLVKFVVLTTSFWFIEIHCRTVARAKTLLPKASARRQSGMEQVILLSLITDELTAEEKESRQSDRQKDSALN